MVVLNINSQLTSYCTQTLEGQLQWFHTILNLEAFQVEEVPQWHRQFHAEREEPIGLSLLLFGPAVFT